METVTILTLTFNGATAVVDAFTNLKKAVELCDNRQLTDSYMIVYRSIKRHGEYGWLTERGRYRLTQVEVR